MSSQKKKITAKKTKLKSKSDQFNSGMRYPDGLLGEKE